MRVLAFTALAVGTLALSGCGIKGGLYLPEVPQAPPAAAPAPVADDTKVPAAART